MDLEKILTAGMALFAIFFGAGNLIFPLIAGGLSGDHVYLSALFFCISSVLFPLLGIVSKVLNEKEISEYFKSIGETPSKVLIVIITLLLGPFGVAPRCIVVAHSGLNAFIETPAWFFAMMFCVFSAYLLSRKSLVDVIGNYLTPLMILGIIVITILGLLGEGFQNITTHPSPQEAISIGFFNGYQTLDLVGAAFFATKIQEFFQNNKNIVMETFAASIIAGALLAITYFSFILIGNMYSASIDFDNASSALLDISQVIFGEKMIFVVSIVIILACLTTFIALIDIAAVYSSQTLSKAANYDVFLYGNLFLSGLVSLCSFEVIKVFLGQVMYFMYPALIAFSVGGLLPYKQSRKYAFYGAIITLTLQTLLAN